jgi:hypothetical protein
LKTIAHVKSEASRKEALMNVTFSDGTEYRITVKEGTGKNLRIQYRDQFGFWKDLEEFV